MKRITTWLASGFLAAAAACATSSQSTVFSNSSGTVGGQNNDNMLGNSTSGGSLGNTGTQTSDSTSCVTMRGCSSGCSDFGDGTPNFDMPDGGTPAPSNAASQFSGTPSTSGGPCIVEPGDGALLPNNWVRPRFRWTASGGQSLFQVTIHSPRESNDYVVYTTSTAWTMPADVWTNLAANAWDDGSNSDAITVTVAAAGSPPAASSMKFTIAPALANGSMIYWAAVGDKPGDSWLEGFHVGDEGVAQVLTTDQVQSKLSRDVGGNLFQNNSVTNMPLPNGPGSDQCIGCHAAVPDQQSVTFLDFYPWPGVASNVSVNEGGATAGAVPSWLTPGGGQALAQPWIGMMSFSKSAWDSGSHIVVTSYQNPTNDAPWTQGTGPSGPTSTSELAWIDLSTSVPAGDSPGNGSYNSSSVLGPALLADQGQSYRFIARNGDSRGAACRTWSHDGSTIVYVSTDVVKDGRIGGQTGTTVSGTADLYSVPYSSKAGGTATPVNGASTSDYAEYYPWFSSDDKYIAFTRAPEADGIRYYAPKSEVYVVKAGGGSGTSAVRLNANDPPSCMNVSSPGIINSWPKWSPENPTCGTKTYYWLVFSSARLGVQFNSANMQSGNTEPTSQLYLTAVVDDGSGNLTTYPGVFVWNQPTNAPMYANSPQSNHTPLWDVTEIPQSMIIPR